MSGLISQSAAGVGETPHWWIPVKKRLPPEDVGILLYSSSEHKIYTGFLYNGRFTGSLGAKMYDITHWMPLPAPPSE